MAECGGDRKNGENTQNRRRLSKKGEECGKMAKAVDRVTKLETVKTSRRLLENYGNCLKGL